MWRHPALRLLSSDHHHALLLARMARHAADSLHPGVAEWAWTQACEQLTRELEPHFALEEAVLLPALEGAGEGELARRTRQEHAALRALPAPLPVAGLPERLRTLAALLVAHTRFEEAELFEAAQRLLSEAQLEAVHAACVTDVPPPGPRARPAQPGEKETQPVRADGTPPRAG